MNLKFLNLLPQLYRKRLNNIFLQKTCMQYKEKVFQVKFKISEVKIEAEKFQFRAEVLTSRNQKQTNFKK